MNTSAHTRRGSKLQISSVRHQRGLTRLSLRARQLDVAETAFVNDGGAWRHSGSDDDAQAAAEPARGNGFSQVGLASWYGGSRWQGRATTSGERYDENEMTAAHATLPLGTMVRVSLRDGGGSVVVRITDRPGTRRRIIDLSHAAAARLGILGRGIAPVKLELAS